MLTWEDAERGLALEVGSQWNGAEGTFSEAVWAGLRPGQTPQGSPRGRSDQLLGHVG